MNGLYCILGLFTSAAYSSPPKDIPLLRKKRRRVLDRARLSSQSHSGKALDNILSTYPRDDLFQVNEDQLLETSLGMLSLQERQRTRLFISQDTFKRYYSCMIYLPRARYNQEVQDRIKGLFRETFSSQEVEVDTHFSESILARIHYIVHLPEPADVSFDVEELEAQVKEATTTWQDGLHQALIEQYGEATAASYFKTYARAFPSGFREDFFPRIAASDVARIEKARATNAMGLSFLPTHPLFPRQSPFQALFGGKPGPPLRSHSDS